MCIKLSRNLLLNLLSTQTRILVKGGATDVVKRGIMAEINAPQLAKQSVQSVYWSVSMQLCARPRRGGAANSLGGRKREAEVNKFWKKWW